MLAKVESGDLIELNTETGELTLLVDDETLAARTAKEADLAHHQEGMGRELFSGYRNILSGAEEGACSLFVTQEQAL